MRYKQLGDSGIQVSAVSLGTWGIGGSGWGEVSRGESIRAIHAALENGVTTIDTAPVYGFGNPAHEDFGYGYAEALLKEALCGQKREKLILTTKCGMNYDRTLGPQSMYKRMTRDEVIAGCEASLKRLGTDYVDVLFIHWPDLKTPIEEPLEAMRTLIEQGKIRGCGLSNFTLEETLQADDLLHITAVQPQYSMVERSFEPLLTAVKARGIGTMTYGSLGSGILTGRFRELPNFPPNDMRMAFYDCFREPKFGKVQKLLAAMDEIAAAHEATCSQIAIQWSAAKSFVDTAILGFSKPKHALQNCAAFDWALSEVELAELDAVIETCFSDV